MKFIFDKDTMLRGVAIAQEIVSTKNAGSILSNILIIASEDKITLRATDIKVHFETVIPVQVEEGGTATIYCDKLINILNSVPAGEIEFSKSDSADLPVVLIRPVGKRINFQVRSMSQDKYPEMPLSDDLPYFEVSSKDFKDMISQVSFAVSEDETRYFMNGVYFEKEGDALNMVATDGRRLSFISKPLLAGVSDFPAAIVHPKILNIVLKTAPQEGNISIAIVDKMIFFKFGPYKFVSSLIEGRFPNYRRVIPQNQAHSFDVSRTEFLDALRRVSLMVDRRALRIYLNISEGTLKVTSSQSDIGSAEEEIKCTYEGAGAVIALNVRYLEEPLKAMDSEAVTFAFTEEMKAVTLKSSPEKDYFHIVMPMQKE